MHRSSRNVCNLENPNAHIFLERSSTLCLTRLRGRLPVQCSSLRFIGRHPCRYGLDVVVGFCVSCEVEYSIYQKAKCPFDVLSPPFRQNFIRFNHLVSDTEAFQLQSGIAEERDAWHA